MSKKQKHKNRIRLSTGKKLLVFVGVFATLAGAYFALQTFAFTSNKHTVYVASGIREKADGSRDKTVVNVSSARGTIIQDGDVTVYKNSVNDGKSNDLTFTEERQDFIDTKPRRVRVCVNGRDWRPYKQEAKIIARIRFAAKKSAANIVLQPKTVFSTVCSDWQQTSDTNYLELDQVIVNEGVASVYNVSWEWR